MSIFNFLGSIFKPVSDIVDEIHVSDEEKGILSNKLAEIESKVTVKVLELQTKAIESQAKMETEIQKHGNIYSRSIRPTISLIFGITIFCMAFGIITLNTTIATGCFAYLGIYNGLRSWEKTKK